MDITAQDLLGKSHEELVLMLIHLRRQGATLNEAITSSKSEMDAFAAQARENHEHDAEETQKLLQDLGQHIRELEEQRTRAQPIISLVDNMVKLGSLYRGPQDAPLSHRIRNVPASATNANSSITSKPSGSSSSGMMLQLQKNPHSQKEDEKEARERRADIQVGKKKKNMKSIF